MTMLAPPSASLLREATMINTLSGWLASYDQFVQATAVFLLFLSLIRESSRFVCACSSSSSSSNDVVVVVNTCCDATLVSTAPALYRELRGHSQEGKEHAGMHICKATAEITSASTAATFHVFLSPCRNVVW